jgi:hypothetical protein
MLLEAPTAASIWSPMVVQMLLIASTSSVVVLIMHLLGMLLRLLLIKVG